MAEDDLLRRLAALAREQEESEGQRLDERWDALSAGTLSPEEEAALEAEARRTPEGEAAWAAFSPLGAEERAATVAKLRRRVRAGEMPAVASEARESAAPAWVSESDPARLEEDLPQLRPTRTAHWGSVAVALAASLVLAVLLLRPGTITDHELLWADLPAETRSGDAAASADEPPLFSAGDRFHLIVKPLAEKAPDAGAVSTRTCLERDGVAADWTVPTEEQRGAVRIRGTMGEDVILPPGGSTVWVVVGRGGLLPSCRSLPARFGPSVQPGGCVRPGRGRVICRAEVRLGI